MDAGIATRVKKAILKMRFMHATSKYPRVLIIGAAGLNEKSATGITLSNLFLGWPTNRIAQIYADLEPPDSHRCENYRKFSGQDLFAIRILKRILRRRADKSSDVVSASVDQKDPPKNASTQLSAMTLCGDLMPFSAPKELVSWASSFKPDVIYSVLGSVQMLRLVGQISKRTAVPVVSHFMDDWPSNRYVGGGLLSLYARWYVIRKLRTFFFRSSTAFAIGDDMAAEFSRRYGGEFQPFMNCVDVKHVPLPLISDSSQPIRFGFVGGLHLNRWSSLLDVIAALQKIKDHGELVTMAIHSPEKDLSQYGEIFSKFSVVTRAESLSASEVSLRLAEFDVLVHVESFKAEDAASTRLSISTKIPQYMAAGRPIFAYGPDFLSSIKYVRNSRVGVVVSEQEGATKLEIALRELVRSFEFRRELGMNGQFTAINRHSGKTERERFRHAILLASNNSDRSRLER